MKVFIVNYCSYSDVDGVGSEVRKEFRNSHVAQKYIDDHSDEVQSNKYNGTFF